MILSPAFARRHEESRYGEAALHRLSQRRGTSACPTVVLSILMRIVGIDLGERRIGVAVSDATATLARPLKTIERGASDAAAVEQLRAAIAEITDEEDVGSVVVGLPKRLDGSPNLQTPRVEKVVAMLAAQLTIPVVTQDERLSSHEADERLAHGEKDWRRRKAKLDAAAAAVILQDYLDARKASGEEKE